MTKHYLAQEFELLGIGHSPLPGSGPAPGSHRVLPGAESAIAGGAYEGSHSMTRELLTWNPSRQSADQDIIPEKDSADARAQDRVRNDAFVNSGANLWRDSIVGSYYMLSCKPAVNALGKGFDEKWEEEFQAETEEKFALASESPRKWLDASRVNNFTEFLRLGIGIYMVSGEVLASVEWLRDSTSLRPFNTALQMVDLARLSTPPEFMSDNDVRGGIRRNQFGAPQGYYIRMSHPSDYTAIDNYRCQYVPIEKPWGRPQMLHIYETTRADQTRGIADMVSTLKELKITKKFRDLVLQNAVVQSSYAASIESELPTSEVFRDIGADSGGPGDAITAFATSYLGQINEYAQGLNNMTIDGIKIPHLFPGTKLKLTPAGKGGDLGSNFEQSLLRYIAAGLGVSYEELSKDYSQTNYSSAKASEGMTIRGMKPKKRFVADSLATSGYRLWFEEAINNNRIDSLPVKIKSAIANGDFSWFYTGMNQDAICKCEWIGASRGMIDEFKETQAMVLRLNNNLGTYENEMARMGMDWRAALRQRKRELTAMGEVAKLQLAMNPDTQKQETTSKQKKAGSNA